LAWGIIIKGWALTEQGQLEEAITQIRQGLAALQTIKVKFRQLYYLSLLVEAYRKAGQAEEGLSVLDEALSVVEKNNEHWRETEEAEACFHQALAIVRQQQAKSLELRAAMSLSRLATPRET
jgi:predicted ATPase